LFADEHDFSAASAFAEDRFACRVPKDRSLCSRAAALRKAFKLLRAGKKSAAEVSGLSLLTNSILLFGQT
jgi:hypothetical protein